MFKRVFSRKKSTQSLSKSIRCTKQMWDAIESLAEQAGESPNSYVVFALDQFLQDQLKAGKIKPPAEEDESQAA